MPKFLIQETTNSGRSAKTVRLGAGTGTSNNWTSAEAGKIVKLGADNRYVAAVAGDAIEGFVAAVENATQDGYTIGSIIDEGYKEVTFDGLQATPGTGTIAAGDYVVAGTVVAKGTALTGPVKVTKATVQIGAVPADLTAAGAQIKASMFAWRVVSLGTAGTGAVGTTGTIERVAP